MLPRIVAVAKHCLRGLAGPLLAVPSCVNWAASTLAAALPNPAKTTYRSNTKDRRTTLALRIAV